MKVSFYVWMFVILSTIVGASLTLVNDGRGLTVDDVSKYYDITKEEPTNKTLIESNKNYDVYEITKCYTYTEVEKKTRNELIK